MSRPVRSPLSPRGYAREQLEAAARGAIPVPDVPGPQGDVGPPPTLLTGVVDLLPALAPPTINVREITVGTYALDFGFPSAASPQTFVYDQPTPADLWTIVHGQQRYPSVFVVDSAGSVVETELQYPDNNTVLVIASGAMAGKAFLN